MRILAPNDPALTTYKTAIADRSELNLQLDIVPFAQYREALDNALQADNNPYHAVFVPGHLWIPELAAAGRIAPLDRHFSALQAAYVAYQPDTILPVVVEESRYNDEPYMLPLFSDGHILFYDPNHIPLESDALRASDVLSLCEGETEHLERHTIALKAHPSEIFLDFLPYLLDHSGNILDANNQPTFNSAAGKQALNDYIALARHAPTDTHKYDNEAIANALQHARVNMATTWGGQAAPIFLAEGSQAPVTYRTAVFTTPWNATWGAAIPTNIPNDEQRRAVEALLYLNTPELDRHVLTAAGSPIRTTTYTTENLAKYSWLSAQQKMLETAILLPKLPEIGQVLGALYGEVYAALRGEKSAGEALSAAESAVNQALGR